MRGVFYCEGGAGITKQKAEADAREVEPACTWGDFACPLSDLWTDAATPST